MKKLYYMLLLAVLSMTFTSCDDNSIYWDTPRFYYVNDILGTWESYYGYDGYGEYDIRGYDVVRYEFYSNFMGRYYFYSMMRLVYIDFEWSANNNQLTIWYADGDYEYLYWGINRNGDLVLSPSKRFRQYTVYCPAGYYYEPGKSLNTESAKCFDPITDEKPVKATMRSTTTTSAETKE